MKLALVFALLPSAVLALDCTPPAPATEVHMYADPWEHEDPANDYIDCRMGAIANANKESGWLRYVEVWPNYEQAVISDINKNPPMDIVVQSFKPKTLMFVTMSDIGGDEAARVLYDLATYRNRVEGNVWKLDVATLGSPNRHEIRPVVIFNDGQVLVVDVYTWRDGCGKDIKLTQTGEIKKGFMVNTFELKGAPDVCKITVTEIAPPNK